MQDLFLDCSTGVSGDMLLGAFLDIGVPFAAIKKNLDLLGIQEKYLLNYEQDHSFHIRGIKVSVENKNQASTNLSWYDIKLLIDNSKLNQSLKEKVLKVFHSLARAESSVHGIDIDQVHFHEVGSIDSLVDITGVCAAVDYLRPRRIFCVSPPAGSGFVETSHGLLPVPVPAVLELARQNNITLLTDENSVGEITTPTGLALLVALADSFNKPPFFKVDSIGVGLGHKKLSRANFLRICLLKPSAETFFSKEIKWEEVVIQEAWIDDASPEDLSVFISQLREAGAIDVACHSIQMKKARMGNCIRAVVSTKDSESLRVIWFSFGKTLGLRERREGRWILPRRRGTCLSVFGKVLVKQALRPNGKLTIKVEHDELHRISIQEGISIDEVRRQIDLESETFSPDGDWIR